MINHLRTLILNEEGLGGTRFDQFIPDGFRSVVLSGDESRIRNLIYGVNATREIKEFTATALARMVYGTDLGHLFIDPLDKRSTIDWDQNQVSSLSTSITLTKLSGNSSVDVFGSFTPDTENGIYSGSWRLTASDINSVIIENLQTKTFRSVSLIFTNGASQVIQLEDKSDLWFRFTNTPSAYPVTCRVDASVPPKIDIINLLTLFRQEPAIRPFMTALGIPRLVTEYDNFMSPVLAASSVLVAYCISISKRLSA